MKILALATLVSFMFAIQGSAQNPGVARAKEILDRVSARVKGFSTLSANFSFTLENLQQQITETHQGSINIKGDKYKVSLMGVNTYFDGNNLWVHMTEVNEVNVSGAEVMEGELLNPATIFTIHEQGFRYIHAGETTINGRQVDIIDLFPEDRDQPFSRIKLFIYRDNLNLARLMQIGKDGNNYIVDIDTLQTNLAVNDTFFTFNPSNHPGIEVIDLR